MLETCAAHPVLAKSDMHLQHLQHVFHVLQVQEVLELCHIVSVSMYGSSYLWSIVPVESPAHPRADLRIIRAMSALCPITDERVYLELGPAQCVMTNNR